MLNALMGIKKHQIRGAKLLGLQEKGSGKGKRLNGELPPGAKGNTNALSL